jgi:hypothetical protein
LCLEVGIRFSLETLGRERLGSEDSAGKDSAANTSQRLHPS